MIGLEGCSHRLGATSGNLERHIRSAARSHRGVDRREQQRSRVHRDKRPHVATNTLRTIFVESARWLTFQ